MAIMGPEDRERFARRGAHGGADPSRREPEPERQRSIKVAAGGSITEALCGAATVVLAIIGLAGTFPGYLASVATIAFGVALLAQGAPSQGDYGGPPPRPGDPRVGTRAEVGEGMGAEVLAGAAGVVLGILGLIGLATATS